MVIMPLTYYAIVRGAGGKKILVKHAKKQIPQFRRLIHARFYHYCSAGRNSADDGS
jgi:hypothetical protein